jgi:hypothetical protein
MMIHLNYIIKDIIFIYEVTIIPFLKNKNHKTAINVIS